MGPSLYRYPDIYAALFSPEPTLRQDVESWIARHLDGPPSKVLDPACGPGNWLLPFADRGIHVAGNDIAPQMVRAAQQRLRGAPHEVVQGDMRDLRLTTGPFDLALSLDASIGHLPDQQAISTHLAAVHGQLRPGGIYILGAVVADRDEIADSVELLHEWEPTAIPSGGVASLRLDSLRRDPMAGQETIRLELFTRGVPDCPEHLEEIYTLQTLQVRQLEALIDRHFQLQAVHSMEEQSREEIALYRDCGEVTLILRKNG